MANAAIVPAGNGGEISVFIEYATAFALEGMQGVSNTGKVALLIDAQERPAQRPVRITSVQHTARRGSGRLARQFKPKELRLALMTGSDPG